MGIIKKTRKMACLSHFSGLFLFFDHQMGDKIAKNSNYGQLKFMYFDFLIAIVIS